MSHVLDAMDELSRQAISVYEQLAELQENAADSRTDELSTIEAQIAVCFNCLRMGALLPFG